MRVLWGSVSLRSSSRFPGSSAPSQLKPVMFPPARQAGDEAFSHRIIVRRHHDGDRAGGVLRCTDPGVAPYHNHLHLESNQLGRQVREPLVPPLRPAPLNNEVLTLDIAEIAQPLPEGLHRWTRLGGRKPGLSRPIRYTFVSCCAAAATGTTEDTQGKYDGEADRGAPHKNLSGATCEGLGQGYAVFDVLSCAPLLP